MDEAGQGPQDPQADQGQGQGQGQDEEDLSFAVEAAPVAAVALPHGRLALAVAAHDASLWAGSVRGGRLLVGTQRSASPRDPAILFSGECDGRGEFSRDRPGASVRPIVLTPPQLSEFRLLVPLLSMQGVCDVMVFSADGGPDEHFLGCVRPVAQVLESLEGLLALSSAPLLEGPSQDGPAGAVGAAGEGEGEGEGETEGEGLVSGSAGPAGEMVRSGGSGPAGEGRDPSRS